MSEEMKVPLFEKIEALIARNDLITAEKLLKKHEALLSEPQREELQRKIIRQRKEKQKCAEKAKKRDLKILKRSGVYWNKTYWITNILFYAWIALGIILYPYAKTNSFAIIPSLGSPNFIMEILFSVQIFVMVLFCIVGFCEAYQDRKNMKEAMNRTKNKDKALFDSFHADEKAYAGAERKWFIALLVTLLILIIHIVYMVKIF